MLNRLLFRAYNANATPQAISPFIVRVFSPEIVPPHLLTMPVGETDMTTHDPKTMEIKAKFKGYMTVNFMGLKSAALTPTKIIKRKKHGYHEHRDEWRLFRHNVEKLAA